MRSPLFLPLLRQTVEAHQAGLVAPLEGIGKLRVHGVQIWFPDGERTAPRLCWSEIRRLEEPESRALEVVERRNVTIDVTEGTEAVTLPIGKPGEPLQRPVYLPGYRAWEHAVGHHDPLADTHVLGLILASLACGLDFDDDRDLERFVHLRRNLFALNPKLHPVVAQAIATLTELDRHQRPPSLPALLRRLETYRDQEADIEFDLGRVPGFHQRAPGDRRKMILARLRDRLFEISRRNRVLYYRPTLSHLNLTEASVPMLFDLRRLRPEQLFFWQPELAGLLSEGKPIPLGRYLRFEEIEYLSPTLDRIRAEVRRDEAEYGFAQLRLVVCFLRRRNLKEFPEERIDSPLVLVPVELKKTKGVRDSWTLEPRGREAEINPVLRHHLRELYGLKLPETLELDAGCLDRLYEILAAQIRASEPGVTLAKIDRPPVRLVFERARRRLDRYRRRERVTGRGVRSLGEIEYSYDRDNFHPLGLALFRARVKPIPSALGDLAEPRPRPASFAAEAEIARPVAVFGTRNEGNPYAWEFDLCNLTLANFRYRKMSLVRDYETLLEREVPGSAFDAIFSLAPKDPEPAKEDLPPLEERFPVVPCDPTQAAAIARSRSGRSYVIQGPPGTGKSQTITNLIADSVARGKRVLFVCEKRAALDVVYHRLKQKGLDELCCLIHDSQEDKKPFVQNLKATYETLLDRDPAALAKEQQERSACTGTLRRELEPLARFDRAMQGTPPSAGVPLHRLLGRLVELGGAAEELPAPAWERIPEYSAWTQGAEAVSRFARRLREVQPDGVFANHPFSALHPRFAEADRPVEAVLEAHRRAEAALDAVENTLRSAGVEPEGVPQAAAIAEYAARLAPLAARGRLKFLDPKSQESLRFELAFEEQERRRKELDAARRGTRAWRSKLPPEELPAAIEQARTLQGISRFFRPAYWRLRRILRERYDFRAHVVAPSWTQVLEALDREYRAAAAFEAGEEEVRRALSLDVPTAEFAALRDELRKAVGAMPAAVRELHERLVASRGDSAVLSLAGLGDRLRTLREAVEALFARPGGSFAEIRENLRRIPPAIEQLPDFLPCLRDLAALPPPLADAFRTFPLPPERLEAACANRSLRSVYRADRELERFTAGQRERHLDRIEAILREWYEANALYVRRRVSRQFLANVRRSQTPSEDPAWRKLYNKGRKELEHEFAKSMRFRPIRDLVTDPETGVVIRDLKPVWLMSPLSVSETVPLDPDAFDAVIFDEASQIPLEDAVPSLFRTRQAIVVGDQMQLPPTTFFLAKDGGEEEAGEEGAFALDGSSFLNFAARNLSSVMLGWHYRSRSEALISFSNRAFYQGRLLTVPEAARPAGPQGEIAAERPEEAEKNAEALLRRPVSFHRIRGVYEGRVNRAEAEYIARLVRALLPARPTIGVVAFSEAQQGEIERALEALAEQDPAFGEKLEAEYERVEEDQFCGLLVKNLENIQGDERDVVILSVCYGYGPDGRMLMNFGPINQAGGEKRLNVAFSRAKKHMAVVSTIGPADIKNEYNDGANCLRNYLRYAAACSAGDGETMRRVLMEMCAIEGAEGAERDAVIESMAARLRAAGFEVDAGVGQSAFRCDLALRRPGEAGYCCAVLVDTAKHYRQPDLLERDVLRPALLRMFGWRVCRVLTKDWFHDPDAVLSRIRRETLPGSAQV